MTTLFLRGRLPMANLTRTQVLCRRFLSVTSLRATAESGKDTANVAEKKQPLPTEKSVDKDVDPTKYNSPEYYSYNALSFYDFETTMRSKRVIKQPSKYDKMP